MAANSTTLCFLLKWMIHVIREATAQQPVLGMCIEVQRLLWYRELEKATWSVSLKIGLCPWRSALLWFTTEATRLIDKSFGLALQIPSLTMNTPVVPFSGPSLSIHMWPPMRFANLNPTTHVKIDQEKLARKSTHDSRDWIAYKRK